MVSKGAADWFQRNHFSALHNAQWSCSSPRSPAEPENLRVIWQCRTSNLPCEIYIFYLRTLNFTLLSTCWSRTPIISHEPLENKNKQSIWNSKKSRLWRDEEKVLYHHRCPREIEALLWKLLLTNTHVADRDVERENWSSKSFGWSWKINMIRIGCLLSRPLSKASRGVSRIFTSSLQPHRHVHEESKVKIPDFSQEFKGLDNSFPCLSEQAPRWVGTWFFLFLSK